VALGLRGDQEWGCAVSWAGGWDGAPLRAVTGKKDGAKGRREPQRGAIKKNKRKEGGHRTWGRRRGGGGGGGGGGGEGGERGEAVE